MDLDYTKIKLGNWLFKYCFPLYNFSYARFKRKNDAFEIAFLKKNVQLNDYVLDIGANIGFYSKILSRIVGVKGKIFCFEPDKTNFKHLQKNTGSLDNVQLFNSAVSDKKDTIKIYKSKLLNVDHRTYPVNGADSVEEIDAISIDDLVATGIVPKVDFIKIDIQGYELVAFKGMLHLLKNSPHLKIVAEFWPHGFRKAGSSAVEFYDFFIGLGYKFSVMEKDTLKPLDKAFVVQHNEEPFEFYYNVFIERT